MAPKGNTGKDAETLRREIADRVSEYWRLEHAEKPFRPGNDMVPVSGRVFGDTEMLSLVESALDLWLTSGPFDVAFSKRLADFLGRKYVLTVNSGSSANLLALSSLTSPMLEDRALQPGDEVITVAAGFPTTLNPILQNGLRPVFVDIDIPTYNVDAGRLEAALGPRTRAVMLAHTLGNPFDLEAVTAFTKEHGLWLVEDCCDALGSTYGGRLVGTFGDLGTLSFYPAHHITTGEGGVVFTADSTLKRIAESMRDWGRDCWCAPGRENTCKKRFDWQLGNLPAGYDHKYIYSHTGYNFKLTDMQAAVGLAQMDRLQGFIDRRKANFRTLRDGLGDLEDVFVLPQATAGSDPSWFGFLLTVREDAPFERDILLRHLAEKKIGTRLLFGGNLTKQPYMVGRDYRVAGGLENTDAAMTRTFWIGVYPGLTAAMLSYVIDVIHDFVAKA
jgi:CDP-6-deoxy-D-xylo-4-hexulose-3-dehydrase